MLRIHTWLKQERRLNNDGLAKLNFAGVRYLGKPSKKKKRIFNDIDHICGRGSKKKPNFIKAQK